MSMQYSIIIPSYNSAATILPCLRSVTQQHFAEPYEVIVVDSSVDATPELICQHFPTVTLLHFDQRTDAGSARNIGIQHAEGDLICLIDSDCIADPAWLRTIVAAHYDNYAAVGGAILNGNPDNVIGWAGYLAEFREFFPFHAKQIVPHIASCNISYKRWVFDRYGGFLCDYYPQEDLVFNLQLNQAKELILFDPAIKVAHLNKTSLNHFLRHQYRIGQITATVLKQVPFLRGHVIAHSRILTLLAAPVLPWVKFWNTFRVVQESDDYRNAFFRAAPLLLFGLWLWGIGFGGGAFLGKQPLKILQAIG